MKYLVLALFLTACGSEGDEGSVPANLAILPVVYGEAPVDPVEPLLPVCEVVDAGKTVIRYDPNATEDTTCVVGVGE